MGFFINEHQSFSGNATDLANLASQCTRYLNLPGDLDKINERIVRYYVAEGLVERPERIGRDAQYGYIHLLQFLAGRFLVESGFPMQKVGPYLMTQSIDQLEALVMNRTKPNMAELLVASFQNGGALGRNPGGRTPIIDIDHQKRISPKFAANSGSVQDSRPTLFESPRDPSKAVDRSHVKRSTSADLQSFDMSMKSAATSSRSDLDQLQAQIHDLNQSMRDQFDRISYQMEKERARSREELEHERLDRRKEREELQNRIDQLIAIVAKQNKGTQDEQ
jgi:hypothetical protein